MSTTRAVEAPAAHRGWTFAWGELTGSLGDLGLFLPVVLAATLAADLDLGAVFILAGAMNVLTGLGFRQPVPVQPMKALAAMVIAQELSHSELLAAGIGMGVVLLVLAACGLVQRLSKWIPSEIVAGIQLAVAFRLGLGAVGSVGSLPWLGFDSGLLAGTAAALLAWGWRSRKPLLLVVFVAGWAWVAAVHDPSWDASPAFLHFRWPASGAWLRGLREGTLSQLPLTLLNSVVALCALSAIYFPDRPLRPRHVAVSVALMNLVALSLGGLPMCHGSSGLAAQHRFGARSGWSVVILGTGKMVAGLALGAGLATLLPHYPKAILGVMLIVAAAELARGFLHTPGHAVAAVTALGCLAWGMAGGTLAGAMAWLVLHRTALGPALLEKAALLRERLHARVPWCAARQP